ncbi:MAG TPA: AAA-like domain-containing protein [Synechococcales cyanobacterium M55_K2018_004]|nr:AAA-like domain-containing protein [Synechococcales cyanobacterium M55_K2018_004]
MAIKKRKILVLTSNPRGTVPLQVDVEARDIGEALGQFQSSKKFDLRIVPAPRWNDVQQALLNFRPEIVHFCGHGLPEGLILEDQFEKPQVVPVEQVVQLFELFASDVGCIVLNICDSESLAAALSTHINYVIGMNQSIKDRAAIDFAVAFYNALSAGKSIDFAYRLGCSANPKLLQVKSAIPVLKKKPTLFRVFISYRDQDPDKSLAFEFHTALKAARHQVFMAAESIRLGESWSKRIQQELETCDYFLLFLSPKSVTSEMVTREIKLARSLRDSRPDSRPAILPIRVQFPITSSLNYEQRSFLDQIQQREWSTEHDTAHILQEILDLLAKGHLPEPTSFRELPTPPPEPPPEEPPLPTAEPEFPRGQVSQSSPYYVERSINGQSIEATCYHAIEQPGALIRIKAPRQMGKTSLMSRILYHAEHCQEPMVPIFLSFQEIDAVAFSNLDKFLRQFCTSVARKLNLPSRLADFWEEDSGSKLNCSDYFQKYLLQQIEPPLVLALDEVDCVFEHLEIAKELFSMLRVWHEQAKISDRWQKLRLVIVHSTEVYLLKLNAHQSPFNVGLSIELPEFTHVEVQTLANRHHLRWMPEQVESLIQLVGGHPYLVRLALYLMAYRKISLSQLLQEAPSELGPYGDHLRHYLWMLEERPALARAMKQVVGASSSVRLGNNEADQLRSIGLVRMQANGEVAVRCELYRQYFGDRLRG